MSSSAHAQRSVSQQGADTARMDEVNAERAVLKNKTMALSDLLAVFRAC